MGQELVPFSGGEFAVFSAGPLGPAEADEGPVVGRCHQNSPNASWFGGDQMIDTIWVDAEHPKISN
jgi:hypothetical protein